MKRRWFIASMWSVAAAWPLAAMAEPKQFELDVPPTTVIATLEITVRPSRGAVLLYVAPDYDKAVRFPGPSSTRAIPTLSRTVRFKLINGAKSFRTKVVGQIDASNAAKIQPSALR